MTEMSYIQTGSSVSNILHVTGHTTCSEDRRILFQATNNNFLINLICVYVTVARLLPYVYVL